MTTFHYRACRDRYETRGIINAASRTLAFQRLYEQGYERIRVRPVRPTVRQFLNRLLAGA